MAKGPFRRRSSRRDFLKAGAGILAGTGVASLFPDPARAQAVSPLQKGVLVDITRCIGCRGCENACRQRRNQPELPVTSRGYGPLEGKLTFTNWTFVESHEVEKGPRRGGFLPVPVKKQCMHCLDPACVSACPAAALSRTPRGSVVYDSTRCLGCRYCMIACPFSVPRYEWFSGLTPRVGKCDFCDDRLAAGREPACVGACPTGALKFGTREEILWEAQARRASNPKRYVAIYGDKIVGGTSWIYLSDTSLDKLGFPTDLPDKPLPSFTWKALMKVPFIIVGVGLALGFTARWRHAIKNGD